MNYKVYSRLSPMSKAKEELILRWMEGDFRAIRESILNGELFPENVPLIADEKSKVELIDLRGINLNGASLGKIDLSSCCFDFGSFRGAEFHGTEFQYSSFFKVDFSGSKFHSVQASPVSAVKANFERAEIADSFFMHSDFNGAGFRDAKLIGTALVATCFVEVKANSGFRAQDCDFLGAQFSNHEGVKRFLKLNNISNDIELIGEFSAENEWKYISSLVSIEELRVGSQDSRGKSKNKKRIYRPSRVLGLQVKHIKCVVLEVNVLHFRVTVRVRVLESRPGRGNEFMLNGNVAGKFLARGDVVFVDSMTHAFIEKSPGEKIEISDRVPFALRSAFSFNAASRGRWRK